MSIEEEKNQETEQEAGKEKEAELQTEKTEETASAKEKADDSATVSIEDIASGEAKYDNIAKAKAGTPKWAQKRFDELTAQIKDKEAEIKSLKSLSIPKERPLPPLRDEFEIEDDYRKAIVEWKDKDDEWKNRNLTEKQEEEEVSRRYNENAQRYIQNTERMRTKYSDYDETVDSTVYGSLSALILESEFAPEIGYFLAKNPQELQRVHSMSVQGAAIEIGRLEAKITSAKKKAKSEAPPPINAIEGDDKVAVEINDSTPINVWMEQRKKQRLTKLQAAQQKR